MNQAFTKPGDSGAMVFALKSLKAIGLHFAGGGAERDGKELKLSYAFDLSSILSEDQFNLSWDQI